MNVLFLTMNVFTDIEMHNIYSDLMKEFIRHGHRPYIVTPREKKLNEATELINYPEYSLLKVQIGNTSNVSLIEKGVSTLTLSPQFYNAVKKHLGHLKFGLILYSTPPITLAKPVSKLKKYFGCKTYLMLKDIFPQNAVDLEMFSSKSLIYRFFRHQERTLYKISDTIGCMSQKNLEYVYQHNQWIDLSRLEICPNAIIPHEEENGKHDNKSRVHRRYNIPDDATVFLYGGNLGAPQGVPFITKCLRENAAKKDCFFIICGNGSEYKVLAEFISKSNIENAILIDYLPKNEYDDLAKGCDVGLIFLDYRFTIPNFPSRILSYMEYSMPVLVCADRSTDIGDICLDGGFGLKCYSNDTQSFSQCVDRISKMDLQQMGKKSREYLLLNYTANICYEKIMSRM